MNADEVRGVRRLITGAGVGLAGGLAALVLPVALLALVRYDPGGFFTFDRTFVSVLAVLVLAGGLLFLLSLFLYRRGFAALRRSDRRFLLASILCLVGTLGFLLLLVAAVVAAGNATEVVTCAQGQPTRSLHCLRSASELGAWAGLAGFALGWLGGVGIVLGLGLAASRYHERSLGVGAALYAVLLLLLVAPAIALLRTVPDVTGFYLLVPVFALVAPAFVLAGTVPELPAKSAG